MFGLIEDYESAIEIETYLKEVPIDDSIGKEITMTIETDLQNNGEFYTDSNGLHMQKRKINSRPTWNLTEINPISGNYYPVTSIISINDSSRKLALEFYKFFVLFFIYYVLFDFFFSQT